MQAPFPFGQLPVSRRFSFIQVLNGRQVIMMLAQEIGWQGKQLK
jgi:hypothetical protein